MSLTTLLINLDRAPDRLRRMDRQLQALGIDYRRVAAVEGADLREPIREFDAMAYRIRVGKQPNKNEIGCYLSHLHAMRTFLEGDATHALILEDDAVLPGDFKALLDEVLAASAHWDILRLSSSRAGRYLQLRDLAAGRRLVINTRVLKNTAGYLISRLAAQRCLESLLPMRRPYDVALDRDWTMGLRSACVVPFPIESGEVAGQIPQSSRIQLWRMTTFHILHLIDHIRRRLYRRSIHRSTRESPVS